MLFVLIALFFNSKFAKGQFNETIRTGRPGQAIGAFTVGKNILQFQQGVDYSSVVDSRQKPYDILSNNVIRFGIMETVELSALIDYQSKNATINDSAYSQSGLNNLHLGFRVHFNNQKGLIPTTGFQMRFKMPDISKEFGINYTAPVMVFIANWSLPKNTSIGTNWICSYSGNDQIPTGKYIINFGFPIYKKISGFVENYGQLYKNQFETRFDGGFAWLVNNNIQLDLSAGYGNNNIIEDYFVSAGVSWRLNFRKKQ